MTEENKDRPEEKESVQGKTEPTDLEAHQAEDMVAKANEAADRMEAANRETARLLQKQESMKVEKILGGKTDITEPKSKEESPEEYAKKVLANDI